MSSPIGELRFKHNGNQKYSVTIDVWEEYIIETETPGYYGARIWVNGDIADHEYFPSEEAASIWIMQEIRATNLTYV